MNSFQKNGNSASWISRILVGFLLTVIILGNFLIPIKISLEKDNGLVLSQNTALAQPALEPGQLIGEGEGKMPGCGTGSGETKTDGSVMGCIASIGYYVIFVPSAWVARLAAAFLDTFLIFSIDDGAYRTEFIQKGWTVVRDVVNLAFIFILIYIAFKIILDLGAANAKKMIATLIIVALLVNFSLFFSRVVIDASNILAHVFYNSMEIKGEGGEGAFGEKSISLAIVSKINPQAIIQKQAFDLSNKQEITTSDGSSVSSWWYAGCLALGVGLGFVTFGAGISAGIACGTLVTGAQVATAFNFNHSGDSLAATYLIITLLASAVNIVMIGVFFSIALLFLARVIGLFLLMILSPIALMSNIIPGLKTINYIGWDDWLKQFFSLAFLAPIFLFFLYLIVMFVGAGMGSDAFTENVKNLRGVNYIIAVTLPFVFIIILLKYTKTISKKLAGEFGTQVVAIGKKAVGAAAIATLGGASAIAGRLAAGRLAGTAGAELRKAAPTSRMARIQLLGLDAIGRGKPTTWAARRIEEEKGGLGMATPPAIKTVLKGVGMGVEEGGYMGQQEKLRDSIKADAELAMLSGRQMATQDAKHEIWKDKYDKDRDAEMKRKEAAKEDFIESDFKNEYKTPYVMTGEQINAITKKDFADRIEYGGNYVDNLKKARDEAKDDNKVFDETSWRQDQKSLKETMSLGEEQAANAIRSDIKDKLPPEFTKKAEDLSKLEKNIDKTNSELARINRSIKTIADEKDVKPDEVTRGMVRDYAKDISVNGSDKIEYTSTFGREQPRGDEELKDYMEEMKEKLKNVREGKTVTHRGLVRDENYFMEETRKVHQDRTNLKDIIDEIKGSLNEKDKLTVERTQLRKDRWG